MKISPSSPRPRAYENTDGRPTWSPDSQMVASEKDPDWSPDGHQIAFDGKFDGRQSAGLQSVGSGGHGGGVLRSSHCGLA